MVNDTEPGVMPDLVLWRGVVRNSSQGDFDAFGARVPSVRARGYEGLIAGHRNRMLAIAGTAQKISPLS